MPAMTLTDGELLAEFAHTRAEAAFAEVIRRHGDLVLNICRRLLDNVHDAEDAAQAVFLVLAGKADALTKYASVAGWLHHVARNVARNAQRSTRQRRAHEQHAAIVSAHDSGADDEHWQRLKTVLDDELDAMPDKYRHPLILFHLEGRSLEECCELVRCKSSALGMRLARGRELLRERLQRRQILVRTSLVIALMTTHASAAHLNPLFISATTSSVNLFAAGNAAAIASTHVAGLAKGALNMIYFAQIKSVAAVLAATCLLGGAAVAIGSSLHAEEQQPSATDQAINEWVASVPKVKDGLSITIMSVKPTYVEGKQPDLFVQFENVSNQVMHLPDLGRRGHYTLLLEPAWRQGWTTEELERPVRHVTLRPKVSICFTVWGNGQGTGLEWRAAEDGSQPVDHLPVGKYRVKVASNLSSDPREEPGTGVNLWVGEIVSHEVEFEIIPAQVIDGRDGKLVK
jgi:RNA polymerase sigma factor (sigma-70 family)